MKSRKVSRSKKNKSKKIRRSKKTKLNRSRIFVDGGLKETVSELLQKDISELQKDISELQKEIENKDLKINHCSRKKDQYTKHFEKLINERLELEVSLNRYNKRINELEFKLYKLENPEN